MSREQAAARVLQAEKELERAKAALAYEERKHWEPLGGRYYVTASGVVGSSTSTEDCRNFGLEYPTEEQAEKAARYMRPRNRLLNYVIGEQAATYEPNWEDGDERKGYVYYNYDTGRYDTAFTCRVERLGTVYMPVPVAEELAERLNSGEVAL